MNANWETSNNTETENYILEIILSILVVHRMYSLLFSCKQSPEVEAQAREKFTLGL